MDVMGMLDAAIWVSLLFIQWDMGQTSKELRKIRELLETKQ
jgi:hypothetical protein